jgi:hypothetical protein
MGLVSEVPPPRKDQQNIQPSSTRRNMPASSTVTEASNSEPQSTITQNTQISNDGIELSRNQDLKLYHQTMQPRSTAHQLTTTSDNKTEVSRKEELQLDQKTVRTQATPPQKVGKNSEEVSSKEGLKVDYTFDFGMHSGKAWDAVPEGYREWILEKKVYGSKGRENLLVALVQAGFDPNQ